MVQRAVFTIVCALGACIAVAAFAAVTARIAIARIASGPADQHRILVTALVAVPMTFVMTLLRLWPGAEVSADRFAAIARAGELLTTRPALTLASAAMGVAMLTVAVWVVISIRNAFNFLLRLREARRLVRRAEPVTQDLRRLVGRVAYRMNTRAPDIRVSGLLTVPSVAGAFRPVLLLPSAVQDVMSTQQLELVIAHELAHIARWDALVNTLQVGIEAVFFFSRSVQEMSAEIRAQRELAADARAAEAFGAPLVLARALERLETLQGTLLPNRPATRSMALAADDEPLLRRIVALAQPQRSGAPGRSRFAKRAAAAAPAMALLLVASLNVAAVPADTVDDIMRLTTPAAAFRQDINARDDAGPFTLHVVGYRAVGATFDGRPFPAERIRQRGDDIRFTTPEGATLLAVRLRPTGGMTWKSR